MGRFKDTDTLTRIDTAPDAPTVRSDFPGDEAETHQLEPRLYAPLRVCPECSLAWETSNKWCPSCGTAFERSQRENSTPTRVMPVRPAPAEPPLTRSARRRGVQAQSAPPAGPPARQQASGGSAAKGTFFALLAAVAVVAAFFAGQATRPSQGEIDRSIAEAVSTAKQSAVASYETAFAKLQEQAAKAIKDARAKGVAEGQASAQSEIDAQAESGQSIFDKVTGCVLHGNC